jgi:transposase-like protein
MLVGTVMESSRLPLVKWFYAFWLVANDKRGSSATYLSNTLKIHYHNAWYLLKRIQTAMEKREESYMLSGVVEVDESYIGGSSDDTKTGRGTDKTEVMMAVETVPFVNKKGEHCLNPVRIKIKPVPDTSGKTVKDFAQLNIKPGSTIRTDGFSSYKVLGGEGYEHFSEPFKHEEGNLHLRWFHTIISNLKSFVQGTFHGLDKKHQHFYFSEFAWRYNRRGLDLFERLVVSAVSVRKIQYSAL